MGHASYICIFVLILGLFFMTTNAHVDLCNKCPYVPVNYPREQQDDAFKCVVNDIWKQDIPLTALGKKYKDAILKMNSNDNRADNVLAVIASMTFNSFIPFLCQKPDACIFAQFINASIQCTKYEDSSQIQEALNAYKYYLLNMNDLATAASLYAAGCDFKCGKVPTDPRVPQGECHHNGFTYNIKELWSIDYPANQISDEMKYLIMKMYRSRNHLDRFLAAITSFSITESGERLHFKWNHNVKTELAKLQLSKPVKQYCCYSRTLKILEVVGQNKMEIETRIQNEKNYLEIGKCKRLGWDNRNHICFMQ